MVSRIETMHENKILHRDIKPDNFLIGLGKKVNQLNVIDFGMSKRYVDWTTGEHLLRKKKNIICGTPLFTSKDTHRGYEHSRKDDLIAISHILVYLFNNGSLPWKPLVSEDVDPAEICKTKKVTSTDELCYGLPECLKSFVKYVYSLGFAEKPDYDHCREIFAK